MVIRTTDQVMRLRADQGFVTPLRPLEPGDEMMVFNTRGVQEWLIHPADLDRHTSTANVQVLEEWPLMNAIQIRIYP